MERKAGPEPTPHAPAPSGPGSFEGAALPDGFDPGAVLATLLATGMTWVEAATEVLNHGRALGPEAQAQAGAGILASVAAERGLAMADLASAYRDLVDEVPGCERNPHAARLLRIDGNPTPSLVDRIRCNLPVESAKIAALAHRLALVGLDPAPLLAEAEPYWGLAPQGTSVSARVGSDDPLWPEVRFEAAAILEGMTDKQILALAECGWGGDYPADDVAHAAAPDLPEVARLIDHGDGFECHLDDTFAWWWIVRRRPGLIVPLRMEEGLP
jgi:hypothetical protein